MLCLVRSKTHAEMATLYITQGFMCCEFRGVGEAFAWSEVVALLAPDGYGREHEIEVELADGRHFFFVFFDLVSVRPPLPYTRG